jgi:hypothetical protein
MDEKQDTEKLAGLHGAPVVEPATAQQSLQTAESMAELKEPKDSQDDLNSQPEGKAGLKYFFVSDYTAINFF